MADENNAMMEGQGTESKADKKAEKKLLSRKRKHKRQWRRKKSAERN